jgi:DNA-binding LacI/PurR family transcriptional regulator
MNDNHPITIKDIARTFKCAPSTVSRALNDHYTINEVTRKAIQEYAKEVGYQRNSVSLSLLNKKTDALGIIVPTIGNDHESSIIEGLYSVLQPLGYMLTICATNESFRLEADYIAKETYDSGHYEHLEMIIQRGIPLIFIDREYEGFQTSRVTVDDYHGAYAVVEHLIAMGCHRIAHLKGPNGLTVSEQRFAGYLDCLKRNNLPIDDELIINTNFNVDSAILPTRHLLGLAAPPDAIFGVNDQVAIGAMRVVHEKGLTVPHNVSVVGFDNSPISAYTYPSLTTVSRPGREIGIEASRLFLSHQVTPGSSLEAIRLPSNLIIRESSLRTNRK